jgi:hypothetical protein
MTHNTSRWHRSATTGVWPNHIDLQRYDASLALEADNLAMTVLL